MAVLQNLFANRATMPLLVVGTLVFAFLFRVFALILVKQVAKSDRKRKKLKYRIPLTPVPRKKERENVDSAR